MRSEELLSVPDAAQYLGIRPWTLRHWISDRKTDVVKYGNGAVRIKRSVGGTCEQPVAVPRGEDRSVLAA